MVSNRFLVVALSALPGHGNLLPIICGLQLEASRVGLDDLQDGVGQHLKNAARRDGRARAGGSLSCSQKDAMGNDITLISP